MVGNPQHGFPLSIQPESSQVFAPTPSTGGWEHAAAVLWEIEGRKGEVEVVEEVVEEVWAKRVSPIW